MRYVLCLRWFAAASVLRGSHLNRALVASGKNAAKAESLRLMNCVTLHDFCLGVVC